MTDTPQGLEVDIPNPRNFCGGHFPDWLEVNLTDKCNAHCAWCVEKKGWHPEFHADWRVICDAAIATGKQNIILLGGEPMLHPDIHLIIPYLSEAGHRVWVTTNGSTLSAPEVLNRMLGVYGVNISIHDSDMERNREITGLLLNEEDLRAAIQTLHQVEHAQVRLNCNCIKGYVDSVETIRAYLAFAKSIGADKVRFAELKGDDEGFVDLAAVLDHKYGLNDNPFKDGCNSDAVIDGIPVNFRQMCGMQTRCRPCPTNPTGVPKQVLYYDGQLYDGWQTQKEEPSMQPKEIVQILDAVAQGTMSVAEAAVEIDRLTHEVPVKVVERVVHDSGGYCQY